MATTRSNSKMMLKLLIDKNGHRVLFAEAGKDFVDFLFHIFALPLGTTVKLLSKEEMVGCLGKLYESIEHLDDTYVQSELSKESVLYPVITPNSAANILLLSDNDASPSSLLLYRCSRSYNSDCRIYYAKEPQATCPSCLNHMNEQLTYVAAQGADLAKKDVAVPADGGGYVKGVVTYMVMDDLVVKPMSTISSITLISSFNVKDLGALEEKVVHLGKDEAVKLLKTSMQMSDKVLTSLFLGLKIV